MNTHGFFKCHKQQKYLDVYGCYIKSLACEVTEILKQRSTEEASFV